MPPLILDGTTGISGVDGTAGTPAAQGTDSNTGVFYATDIVGISTGGTERMRIDSSGNVGIGATPSTRLHVKGTDVKLLFETNTGATSYIQQLSASPYDVSFYNQNNGYLRFGTNDTERMRIPAAGGVQAVTTISVGNATPASTGAGITFPATQSASSDANTLDDYEEGSWTPTMVPLGGSFSVNPTYTTQTGTYTKIGRFVYCNFTLILSGSGTGSGGPLVGIGGFPFTVGEDILATGNFFFSAFGANWIHMEMQPRTANTNGYIVGSTAAAAATVYMFHATNITNTTQIRGNFVYAV